MSSAIIGGLIKSGYPPTNIIAANPSPQKLKPLSDNFTIRTTHDNNQAAEAADVVVLGVKPFLIQTVCADIQNAVSEKLIISIAAGKTINSIKKYLDSNNPVIRVMPNTPCLLAKGAIGLYAGADVSQLNQDYVSSLFTNIGEIIWLDTEQQMDIVTALSGSGPAYYFYLTEALVKAGHVQGLSEDISRKLVNQTALGSVAMLNDDLSQTAADLRKSVTSPNGTTEAAIKVFDQANLMQIVSNAVSSATNRGEEMSKESE